MSRRGGVDAGQQHNQIRTILQNITTAAPYDVCTALAALESKANKSRAVSQLFVDCMAKYRKVCGREMKELDSMSQTAQDIYYQFRQATTFQKLVDAYDQVNPKSSNQDIFFMSLMREHRNSSDTVQDKNQQPEARATRKELCQVQEHFESMLVEVFSQVTMKDGILDELKSLWAEAGIAATTNLMSTVFQAISQNIQPSDVGNVVLWTLRLMKPGGAPPMDTSSAMELLGSVPAIEPPSSLPRVTSSPQH